MDLIYLSQKFGSSVYDLAASALSIQQRLAYVAGEHLFGVLTIGGTEPEPGDQEDICERIQRLLDRLPDAPGFVAMSDEGSEVLAREICDINVALETMTR